MLSDAQRRTLTGLVHFLFSAAGRLLLMGLGLGSLIVMVVVVSGVVLVGTSTAEGTRQPVRVRRLAPQPGRLATATTLPPTRVPVSVALEGGLEVTQIDLPTLTPTSAAVVTSPAPILPLPAVTVTPTVMPLTSPLVGWPAGGKVSQGFGCSPYFTGRTAPECGPDAPWFHDGLDIANQEGAPVRPALNGTVVFAGPDTEGPVCGDYRGYGLSVIVDNGQGWLALYAHLSRIEVEPGQLVGPDTLIGAVGASGCTSGPHLHFGLKQNGRLVDPALFIFED